MRTHHRRLFWDYNWFSIKLSLLMHAVRLKLKMVTHPTHLPEWVNLSGSLLKFKAESEIHLLYFISRELGIYLQPQILAYFHLIPQQSTYWCLRAEKCVGCRYVWDTFPSYSSWHLFWINFPHVRSPVNLLSCIKTSLISVLKPHGRSLLPLNLITQKLLTTP